MATKLTLTTGIVYIRSGIDLAVTTTTATRDAIATTSTDGFILANTTASTAGVPVQQSPRIRLRSNVWNTTVVAANNTDDWIIESVPGSAATPSGLLKFGSSLNGAGYTFPMTVNSTGTMTLGGGLTLGTGASIQVGNAGLAYWAGRAVMSSPADSQWNLTNNAQSAGFGLAGDVDGTMKVRTRAQSAYATVDALAYKVSGAAGVSFGPAAVASITVVNGIVTAIS